MAIRDMRMSFGKSATLLTVSGMFEFALQFLLPVILVRHLDTAEFGQYRVLMLMLGTAVGILPAFMPQSLYYFLPRASDRHKRAVIGSTLAYLAAMGALLVLIASPLNPWEGMLGRELFGLSHGMSALFLGLSIALAIMGPLAIAEGRILWQFYTDLFLALARTGLIAAAALLTNEVRWVIAALAVDAVLRAGIFAAYMATRPGGPRLRCRFGQMLAQLRYSLPFALASSLFMLRTQSDQWITASTLPAAAYAAFAIGAVVLPVSALIRQPINNAMLPHLNAEFSAGNRQEVHRLLVRGSSAATLLLVPMAATLFILAPEIIALVYTDKYLAAVPVMRAYLVLIMMQSFAIGYAMPALGLGRLALQINAAALAVSVCCSLAGVRYFGLAGAALGSVVAFALSELMNIRVISRVLGIAFQDMFPLRILFITLASAGSGLLVTQVWTPVPGAGLWLAIGTKLALFGGIALAVFATAGGMAELRRMRRST